MKTATLDVTIREHATSTTDWPRWLAIVTIRGRCYYGVYADERPSEDKVRADWREDGGARSKNWSPHIS